MNFELNVDLQIDDCKLKNKKFIKLNDERSTNERWVESCETIDFLKGFKLKRLERETTANKGKREASSAGGLTRRAHLAVDGHHAIHSRSLFRLFSVLFLFSFISLRVACWVSVLGRAVFRFGTAPFEWFASWFRTIDGRPGGGGVFDP